MPTANPDFYSCPHDQTLYIPAPGVLTNDAGATGAKLVSGVTNGQLILYSDGAFDYAPNPGYAGSDSFEYKAVDAGGGESGVATVQITVENTAPTAVSDSYSTVHDRPLFVPAPGVLINDFDQESDYLTAELASDASHGQLILYSDGGVHYIPDRGYVGADTFTYYAKDGAATSAAVTVTINVTNEIPQTAPDLYETTQDLPLFVPAPGVLTNDTDPDGDQLEAKLTAGPSHGQLLLCRDGEFAYLPDSGYVGSDGFQYVANDGASDSLSTAVTINVTAAPVPPPPAA